MTDRMKRPQIRPKEVVQLTDMLSEVLESMENGFQYTRGNSDESITKKYNELWGTDLGSHQVARVRHDVFGPLITVRKSSVDVRLTELEAEVAKFKELSSRIQKYLDVDDNWIDQGPVDERQEDRL